MTLRSTKGSYDSVLLAFPPLWKVPWESTIPWAQGFLKALPQWFESLVPSGRLNEAAFEMACLLGHPVYDCQYLALAEDRETRLVTADLAFVDLVGRSRWKDRIESLTAQIS